MPILNYTTKIDSIKTISEIQQILVRHGATKITTDYEGGIPVGVTFCLVIEGQLLGFSLPCNYMGVLTAMDKNRKVARNLCTKEQALRVSWRILKDWTAAQCAITEAKLADMVEVFLPYALTKDGITLYKSIKENKNNILMLQSG